MNWLPVVSVVGLIIAVLALGCTVIVLAAWSKRQHGPSAGGPSRQEHSEASQDGSTAAEATGRFPSISQIGFRHPRKAFRDAFMNGDTQSAIAILPELVRILGSNNPEYLVSAGALAAVGAQIDLQPLLAAIDSNDVSDETLFQFIVSSTVQYYVSTDQEQEGLDRTKEVLNRHIHDTSRSKEFRAGMANQLQMLYLGVGETDNALDAVRLAIELSPGEPSYYFNLSIIYEKRENLEQAIEAIERCMEMKVDVPDPDHIFQAWNLYRQIGNGQKMKAMRDLLSAIGHQHRP